MQLTVLSALSYLLSATRASSERPFKPCTAVSPTTERFFDLNPLHRTPPGESSAKNPKDGDASSWHAKGHDYGANFTINFCGPVVEQLDNVVDLDKDLWRNVSAYYQQGDKQYALGLESYEPVFRGRKLVLNYTGGSLCPSDATKRAIIGDNDDKDKDNNDDNDNRDDKDNSDSDSDSQPAKERPSKRRKTAVISLLCESDPLAKTSVSFVAAINDCVYVFEGRSPHACGGVHVQTQAASPGGLFLVIVLIALLVYLAGGCVYQRTVMHQRGWRQLPNYHMWAGIARFVVDLCVIMTSSCARFLPSRRGYSRVALGYERGGRARRSDDEDRLIDNLDEEWDD